MFKKSHLSKGKSELKQPQAKEKTSNSQDQTKKNTCFTTPVANAKPPLIIVHKNPTLPCMRNPEKTP